MPGDELVPDRKTDTKASSRIVARRPRSSSDESDNPHTEGDEQETDLENADESSGERERVTAAHKPGPASAETKKVPPAAGEQTKSLSTGDRLRFRRRIKPRR